MPNPQPYISLVIPVFNPGKNETDALEKISQINNLSSIVLEVIVVNDSPSPLPESYKRFLHLLPNPKTIQNNGNLGRAGSINNGAKLAKGTHVWILDADCWIDHNTIRSALSINWLKSDAVSGRVDNVTVDTFWARYQNRNRSTKQGMNTANFIIKKETFDEIGGFDNNYRTYGFEDRDLIARLSQKHTITYNPNIITEHIGHVSLSTIKQKMRAAAVSGSLYDKKHPVLYRNSPYSSVDFRYCGIFKRFSINILSYIIEIAFPALNYITEMNMAPFQLKKLIVLLVSSTSYYKGSKENSLAVQKKC